MDTAALLMLREASVSSDVRLAHDLEQHGTWRGRLGLVWRRVFPSRVLIAAAYPVRPDSPRVYLYYLPHLWRLTRQRLPQWWTTWWQGAAQDEVRQLSALNLWLEGTETHRR
jgi:hypothetical protein